MTETLNGLRSAIGRRSRDVALALIAGVVRRIGFHQIEARIMALPVREQAVITVAVLALMFLLALFAAQFGVLGMAFYLLAIVLIVR